MDIELAKQISLDKVKDDYRAYLREENYSANTINTSCTDAFYLYRKCGPDAFWSVVFSNKFEDDARLKLFDALKQNSKGDPHIQVNGYLFHLREFRRYFLANENIEWSTPMEQTRTYTGRVTKTATALCVPAPSPEKVDHYIQKWNTLENYHMQEDALDKLFITLAPRNVDLSDILIKVAALNDFYSTHIFSAYPVAKHILSLNIDERLKAGDDALVGDIQKIAVKDKTINFYSFSTKYCSHHNPLDFPIYDSYVETILWYFRNRDEFSVFKKADLKDYPKFKRILLQFRSFYGLEQYNLKQIDKYIWQLGKEYFPKEYGKKGTKYRGENI